MNSLRRKVPTSCRGRAVSYRRIENALATRISSGRTPRARPDDHPHARCGMRAIRRAPTFSDARNGREEVNIPSRADT
jgi:hypothetical protein